MKFEMMDNFIEIKLVENCKQEAGCRMNDEKVKEERRGHELRYRCFWF